MNPPVTPIVLTILLVEDDPAVREVFAVVFSEAGYKVKTAEDGFSALQQLRAAQPDIILSDLHMPGMSGFELLSVVRRRFPSIPVIAMSAGFQGDGIPPDVAADAFYEKGADSLSPLFQMMQVLTHPGRQSPSVHTDVLAPVWMPRDCGEARGADGRQQIILTCPECLRTFPIPRSSAPRDQPVAEIQCIYCQTSVRYAVSQHRDVPLLERFPRKIAAGVPTAISLSHTH